MCSLPFTRIPFEDRADAGRALAIELAHVGIGRNGIVLGLARGGVPVAFEIADRLRLALDVTAARKIGVPWQPELAVGAIAGSVQLLDTRVIRQLGISNKEIEIAAARERAEMKRHEALYRGGLLPFDLQDRSVLLVDDGLATGSTMLAALRYVRVLNPGIVIVAVPVGTEEGCERLRRESDELICLATPRDFTAVSQWYREFRQISDTEVRNLLAENRRRLGESSLTSAN